LQWLGGDGAVQEELMKALFSLVVTERTVLGGGGARMLVWREGVMKKERASSAWRV